MSKIEPLVAVLMGSESDIDTMEYARGILNRLEVPIITRVLSAHRTPDLLIEFIEKYEHSLVAFICGAGMSAHLAGVVAAHTNVPVLGVPLESGPFKGQDALFSTVQMPPGIPVATFGIGKSGAINAALFAAKLAAQKNPFLIGKLKNYRENMKELNIQVNKKYKFDIGETE